MNVWTQLTDRAPAALHFLPGRVHVADPEGEITVREITSPATLPPEVRVAKYGRRPLSHVPAVDNPWGLTPPRCAILSWLADGMTYQDIARTNDCNAKLVEQHMHAAIRVMGAINRTHAVAQWVRFITAREVPA